MLIFYFETRACAMIFFYTIWKNKFQEHYDTCDKKLSKHIKVHWKPNNFSFHNTDAQMQSSLVFTIKTFPPAPPLCCDSDALSPRNMTHLHF